MADAWEVGPSPRPCHPFASPLLCSEKRSTSEFPQGVGRAPSCPRPVAPGQWSGGPRTRTAGGRVARWLGRRRPPLRFSPRVFRLPGQVAPPNSLHPLPLWSPQDGEVRAWDPQEARGKGALGPKGPLLTPCGDLAGGFTETSADWMQRPCSRAGGSMGASWLGPVARTRVTSLSLSGRRPAKCLAALLCQSSL